MAATSSPSTTGSDHNELVVFASQHAFVKSSPKLTEEDYEELVSSVLDGVSVADQTREYYKTIDDGQTCLLDILDSAGQEEYSSMRDVYIRDGDCFLIVFSITSRSSFEMVRIIYQQLCRLLDLDQPPCVIAANKVDLADHREVPTYEIAELANQLKCPYFETSAKTRINVEEAFFQACREALPKSEKTYRILVLGEGGVGKVCFYFILSLYFQILPRKNTIFIS